MSTKRLTALVEQADQAARFANSLNHVDTEALRDCLLAVAETQRGIIAYLEADEAAYESPAPEREPEGDIASAPVGCWVPILFVAMLVGLVLLENC